MEISVVLNKKEADAIKNTPEKYYTFTKSLYSIGALFGARNTNIKVRDENN